LPFFVESFQSLANFRRIKGFKNLICSIHALSLGPFAKQDMARSVLLVSVRLTRLNCCRVTALARATR
jgi:hypothetical protein